MSRQALMRVLDLKTKKLNTLPNLYGTTPYKPFGMTWNNDHFFIAQSTNIVDLDGLPIIENLWDSIHQILWKDGFLYMVSPHITCLKRYDFLNKKMDYLHLEDLTFKNEPPLVCRDQDKVKFQYDLHHFNSILIKNNRAYIAAHNYNQPSFILELEYPSFNLIKRHENMGYQIHNIHVENDEIFTIDSNGSGCIVSNKGSSIPIFKNENMFGKGLAVSKDYFITGYFPKETRANRENSDVCIVLINRATKKIDESITMKNIGSLCGIRLLDEYDEGHLNIPCPHLDEISKRFI